MPTFDEDDIPKLHWFIYETIWESTDITNKNKQIAQFIGSLRKIYLTWYMNFNENQSKYKNNLGILRH